MIPTRSKIKDIDNLTSLLEEIRTNGDTVVLCHGVFDLLHIGHIRHFEEARRFGDRLVVTITPDRYVNKGPTRPIFTDVIRAEAIAALDSVDYVAINNWPTAVELINLLKPNYYVKGSDYRESADDQTGGILLEKQAVSAIGGELVFTDDITFSSSNLINQHMSVFPKGVQDYLSDFGSRYSSADVISHIDDVRSLKVLVVGETIIDEYVYCETLGKSGKDPVLAARQVDRELFAGGILAVANHVAAICDTVGLVSCLGPNDSWETFIEDRLDRKVNKMFLYLDPDSPTILKRRFVEVYPFQRLFELYIMGNGESQADQVDQVCRKLEEQLPQYDVIIVTDYGHGMISSEVVDVLCERSPFLAVNTQLNAGNQGFNTISKYRRANLVCISENEIRLEARSRRRDIKDIVLEYSERLSCDHFIITQGQKGCLTYSRSNGFSQVPAMAGNVIDRMGAGDAVLSVSALCVAKNTPMDMVGFIANAVGAEAVATVGNRSSIERISLIRHIETLLK